MDELQATALCSSTVSDREPLLMLKVNAAIFRELRLFAIVFHANIVVEGDFRFFMRLQSAITVFLLRVHVECL